jgi:hypothetical protein
LTLLFDLASAVPMPNVNTSAMAATAIRPIERRVIFCILKLLHSISIVDQMIV